MADNIDPRLVSCMSVRPEVIGFEGLLNPVLAYVSSPRGGMMASQIGQAVVLDHADIPALASGFEAMIGRYTFGRTVFPEQVIVRSVIPKFRSALMTGGSNPSQVVIYTGCSSNTIGYFQLDQYTRGEDGFGYKNVWENQTLRKKDAYIPKGEVVFSRAPNQDGSVFKYGINANIVFMTHPAVTQDAIIISKSFQKKLKHTAIYSTVIELSAEQLPLNLYGDDITYKVIPDINEEVGEGGILMACRKISGDPTFLHDLDDANLTPNMHDVVFRAPKGATVVDVTVHIGQGFRGSSVNPEVYRQLKEYHDQQTAFYQSIVETYFEFKAAGFEADVKFAELVEYSIGMLCIENTFQKVKLQGPARKELAQLFMSKSHKAAITPMNKKESIDFMRIEVVYAHTMYPSKGYKLTGRQGNKGVISDVWDDERMPINSYGVRADGIACPKGAFNRMNIGQCHEQFLTGAAEVVRKRISEYNMNDDAAYKYVLGFVSIVWPEFAVWLDEQFTTDHLKSLFIQDIKDNGLPLVMFPMLKINMHDVVLKLAEQYDIKKTPIKYVQTFPNGSADAVNTETEFMIGKVYFMLLCKNPEFQEYGASLGYVSQFQLPVKPTPYHKQQDVLKKTVIRFGEDETALLIMSTGAVNTVRLMGIAAGCSEATEELANALMTVEHPTQFRKLKMSTRDIILKSSQVQLFHHMFGAIGIKFETRE